jgi:ribosomal protein L7/L12
MALVDSAPVRVMTGVSASKAHAAADRLTKAGASMQILSGSSGPGTPPVGPARSLGYDVVLKPVATKAGRRTHLVPLIRDLTGLSQNKASRLVDSAPTVVRSGLHRPEADFIVKQLEKVRAKAELRPSESASRSRTPSLFRLASQKLREKGEYPLQAISLGFRSPPEIGEVPEPVHRMKMHLIALSAKLEFGEQVHNLAFGSLDWNDGIVGVTDRRLIFVWCGGATPSFSTKQFRFDSVTAISDAWTVSSGKLQINEGAQVKAISKILPGPRKNEILTYVRRKIAA